MSGLNRVNCSKKNGEYSPKNVAPATAAAKYTEGREGIVD
jgi:hypothetical protein